jgi:hypothetical protein
MFASFRKNAWVFQLPEWLALFLFIVYFLLSLAAELLNRSGVLPSLGLSSAYLFVWASWMFFLAWRLPPPKGFWRWSRGLLPYLALALMYDLMRYLVPVVHPATFDHSMAEWTVRAGGPDAAFWAAHLGRTLTDLFSAFYLSLFVWLFGLMGFLLVARRPIYNRFLAGLMLVHAAGYMGYLLFPAVGPRYAYVTDWSWLSGGWMTHAANTVVSFIGVKFDVFPSLHAAISSYLCFWQGRHDRRGLLWAVPLTVGIWLSTLALGFHYLPDLVSGVLVAAASIWITFYMEKFFASVRAGMNPPMLWLEDLVECEGARWGKLAGRLSEMMPLGGRMAPGFLFMGGSRAKGEDVVRRALDDLGEGPFWLRPSDASASSQKTLVALKPLSRETVVRSIFSDRHRRAFVVQSAVKVTALGLTRSLPPQWMKLNDVELRLTSLPLGRVSIHRLKTKGRLGGGWVEAPWHYFPEEFPMKGWELFEVVQLARQLSRRWAEFTEVEWVLSEGRAVVLDGRPVRFSPVAESEDGV